MTGAGKIPKAFNEKLFRSNVTSIDLRELIAARGIVVQSDIVKIVK